MGTEPHSQTTGHDPSARAAAILVIGRVVRGFFRASGPDAAAGLTFYAVLAGFPALIAAFSVIGLIGRKKSAIAAMLDVGKDVLPPDVLTAITGPLERAASTAGGGWVLAASLLLALWAVARYVTALGRAINRAYGLLEGRVLWKVKPAQLLITLLVFVLALLAGLLAAVSWPVAKSVGDALGAGDAALLVWRISRWPAVVIVVVVIVAVLYYFAPNIQHAHFRLVSVGAAVAILLLAAASVGFGYYVANLAGYDRVYGSFAGIVIFLVWLWIGNMALVIGAHFDAELERVRELRAGIPAERELQVEMRDTERLERIAERDAQDEREARRLRRSRR